MMNYIKAQWGGKDVISCNNCQFYDEDKVIECGDDSYDSYSFEVYPCPINKDWQEDLDEDRGVLIDIEINCKFYKPKI